MKFTKFGRALLMGALSAGVAIGITSCNKSYPTGYLYVTGTQTAGSSVYGIVSGYEIDHNAGTLTQLGGLPISSGGSNPVRALLSPNSRFLYVLNRGVNTSGTSACVTATPCQGNITLFSVGGNGSLSYQATYTPQGLNSFRMLADADGTHLYVLDHDASATSATASGDISAYSIDANTGRLTSLSTASYAVPANTVDMIFANGNLLTLSAPAATVQSYPYTGGTTITAYPYTASTGALTLASAVTTTLTDGGSTGVPSGTALAYLNSFLYVMDNVSITVGSNTYPSQILGYTVSSAGALTAMTGGPAFPDVASQSNPVAMIAEINKGWLYVANHGNFTDEYNSASGINAYAVDTTGQTLTKLTDGPFGTGSGPECIVEDPSGRFLYTANYNDSTVTGRSIDQNTGDLRALTHTSTYTLSGQPTWCLIDGRTN